MQGKGNLLQDLSTLNVSETFVSQSAAMALHTLADVMAADISRLRQHEEFTVTWYQQLLNLLDQQGLLNDFEKKLR